MEDAVLDPAFEWERLSSSRKIRVLSYWLRWRKRESQVMLTVEDLNTAKQAVFKRCQNKKSFQDVCKKISKGQPLSSSDHWINYRRFWTKMGCNDYMIDCNIQSQVRSITQATSSEIPWRNRIRQKCSEAGMLHQGFEKRFEERQSQMCKILKKWAGISQPFISYLPRERLQERVFSFTNTGVDYFGPFEGKCMRKAQDYGKMVLSLYLIGD